MSAFANATCKPGTDGIPYAVSVAMPALEGDLFNRPAPASSPIPVLYNMAVSASVELSVSGSPPSQTTYVVLQTDLGDGAWYDLAWCLWTGVAGSANFLLAAGIAGANSVQQTRQSGTAPASSGSIQAPLGGRIRFVGKTSISTGSSSVRSSSSGLPASVQQVVCTIQYKLLGLV